MQLHPEMNLGDSGSIEGHRETSYDVTNPNTTLLHSIPEEMSERGTLNTERDEEVKTVELETTEDDS